MSDHANIELARRLLAAFETGDLGVVDELIHPAHRDHAGIDRSSGPDGVRDSIRWMGDTFAQRRIELEDVIASGDRIVARVRFTATPGAGGAAADGRVEAQHVHIWRVAYGRLAEHWMVPGELVAGAAVTSD